jgi:hypothetical protein
VGAINSIMAGAVASPDSALDSSDH